MKRIILMLLFLIMVPITSSLGQEVLKFPYKTSIPQRTTQKVSIFKNRVSVYFGDITGGQVIVRVIDSENNKNLHDNISMKEYDSLTFNYEGTTYYLQVTKLRNFLLGSDDNGDILITNNKNDFLEKPKPKEN